MSIIRSYINVISSNLLMWHLIWWKWIPPHHTPACDAKTSLSPQGYMHHDVHEGRFKRLAKYKLKFMNYGVPSHDWYNVLTGLKLCVYWFLRSSRTNKYVLSWWKQLPYAMRPQHTKSWPRFSILLFFLQLTSWAIYIWCRKRYASTRNQNWRSPHKFDEKNNMFQLGIKIGTCSICHAFCKTIW